ncbi:hypothetical protein F5051DRAFT_433380 [Lentinula edodes]|nr:hypothetical protein F5051DRAFT_433380 [Lentinula edodes]
MMHLTRIALRLLACTGTQYSYCLFDFISLCHNLTAAENYPQDRGCQEKFALVVNGPLRAFPFNWGGRENRTRDLNLTHLLVDAMRSKDVKSHTSVPASWIEIMLLVVIFNFN